MPPCSPAIESRTADPAAIGLLADLMASHPCYAFVANAERTGPKALFRGRWAWEAIAVQLAGEPTVMTIDDERASGYICFRLYGQAADGPRCLAEVEVYFARGDGRTLFWCEASERAGLLSLVA